MQQKISYTRRSHPHVPRNVNALHKAALSAAGFNKKVAVAITRGLGTMWCAYVFLALALYGFPGVHAMPAQYVQWLSQTVIQLVALSVLAVGQTVLSEHAEIMADEQFQTTQRTYHDIEQVMEHLNAQDEAILRTERKIETLLQFLQGSSLRGQEFP